MTAEEQQKIESAARELAFQTGRSYDEVLRNFYRAIYSHPDGEAVKQLRQAGKRVEREIFLDRFAWIIGLLTGALKLVTRFINFINRLFS